ncbi:RILP-like protein 1 isoform X2 [Patella vulgata]|uniref:RILP-like protein 1 isoform X2 n=1 Tax=Patella vulgata TaxID=6465 RepID=UPI0024A7ABEE|nr:RILP-like protein 1 isoform X2 [Patella vulgata]
MDPFACRRRMMASEEIVSISVTDVYDQAAGIAQEFDKLITSYGHESVTDLMPKVIRTLEQLENLANKYEKESEEITQLRYVVDKLETEKNEKAQERARFEQELENIEDNWQCEVKELLALNNRLLTENKKLRENLHEHKQSVTDSLVIEHQKTEEQEIKVLSKLKETVDKQRGELRHLRRELQQQQIDCEALQLQLERIAKVNADLRRKNNLHTKQSATLIEEQSELAEALKSKDEQVQQIKERLQEQDNDEVKRIADIRRLRHESREDSEDENCENIEDLRHRLSMEGKMIIDLTDPNRPRFTLHELREVLMERNELKTKLIEIEEELSLYKPNESSEKDRQNDKGAGYRGEEVLVYGPINKEPEHKINPVKKQGGIRKFFQSLIDELDLPQLNF